MASKLDRLQKKGFKVNEAALSKIARGDQEPGGEYSEININDIEENPDNALYRELDTARPTSRSVCFWAWFIPTRRTGWRNRIFPPGRSHH